MNQSGMRKRIVTALMVVFLVAAGVQSASAGLVAHYEFEGSTTDSSGNGRTGTFEGNASITNDAARGNVYYGEKWTSGTGTGMDINAAVAFPNLPTNGGVTLAAWVKRSSNKGSASSLACPIALGAGGDNPIVSIAVTTSGKVYGYIEGTGSPDSQVAVGGADGAVADDVWAHIAITFDRANDIAKVYVDGLQSGPDVDISGVGDGELNWAYASIGRFTDGHNVEERHFSGLIDDARIYDHVLSASEIAALVPVFRDTFNGTGALGSAWDSWRNNSSAADPGQSSGSYVFGRTGTNWAQAAVQTTSTVNIATLDSAEFRFSIKDFGGSTFGVTGDGKTTFFTGEYDGSLSSLYSSSLDGLVLRISHNAINLSSFPDAAADPRTWVEIEKTDGTLLGKAVVQSTNDFTLVMTLDANSWEFDVEGASYWVDSGVTAGLHGYDVWTWSDGACLRMESWNVTTADFGPASIDEVSITVFGESNVGSAGMWTLAVLPDTQHYSLDYPGVFLAQAGWIHDHVRKNNIRYVLHLGDITDRNTLPEWERAAAAFDIIDNVVPYAFVPGNHDYGVNGNPSTRDTFMNDYLHYENYTNWPTFGGAMEVGKMDNTYHLFDAWGHRFIVICLEWGPLDSTIDWAESVLDNYPDRYAILVTHAYMNNDDLRYDYDQYGGTQEHNPHSYTTPGPVNDGEELWQKLVNDYNFVLTLNGHVIGDGTGYRVDTNSLGNAVHQMLVNYQWPIREPLGGEGYMRLLEFQPDGRTVVAKSYSPIYNDFLPEADQKFSFKMDLGQEDLDADGILDYHDADFDWDGDGLDNRVEFEIHGTSTRSSDSDGDGLGDSEEVSGGTNPTRSDTATLGLIIGSPDLVGLYDEGSVSDLFLGHLGIQVSNGTANLQVQLESSTNLIDWVPAGSPVDWNMPVTGTTDFFRVKLDKNNP